MVLLGTFPISNADILIHEPAVSTSPAFPPEKYIVPADHKPLQIVQPRFSIAARRFGRLYSSDTREPR